jgi:hypothetical protein
METCVKVKELIDAGASLAEACRQVGEPDSAVIYNALVRRGMYTAKRQKRENLDAFTLNVRWLSRPLLRADEAQAA